MIYNKIMIGLLIMGKGMAGIFAVIIIIMLGVIIMNKITERQTEKTK